VPKSLFLLPGTRHVILITLLRFANAASRRRASKIEKQKSIQNLPKSHIRAASLKAKRICTEKKRLKKTQKWRQKTKKERKKIEKNASRKTEKKLHKKPKLKKPETCIQKTKKEKR
jgi:hypothetical protein